MNRKLKEKIKKHLEEHLSITDDYAKMAYGCDDIREIIYSLVQVEGMHIVSNVLSNPNNNGEPIHVWVYDATKRVATCKDCMHNINCIDYKKGNSIPCLFFEQPDVEED